MATLVGPILGGVLVDGLGWEWIFFINIPVGMVGFVLAWRLVPALETHMHKFDWLGVVLSGVGMFLLVFGIQEGHHYDWGTITGPITVWSLIISGLVVFGLFVCWQARNRSEPLVPLGLFRDRNFSLANVAISTMGFAITALAFPLMLYAQAGPRPEPDPGGAAAGPDGGDVDRAGAGRRQAHRPGAPAADHQPRVPGDHHLAGVAVAMVMTADSTTWQILLPMTLLGIGNAGVWAPNSATATRNLPVQQAGAGAGVYNATRQLGAVLGSAADRGPRWTPGWPPRACGSPHRGGYRASRQPARCRPRSAAAMSTAMLLPAAVLLLGLLAVLFLSARATRGGAGRRPEACGRASSGQVGLRRPRFTRAPARPGGTAQAEIDLPAERRFSQASTTRAAMPASAGLAPGARVVGLLVADLAVDLEHAVVVG